MWFRPGQHGDTSGSEELRATDGFLQGEILLGEVLPPFLLGVDPTPVFPPGRMGMREIVSVLHREMKELEKKSPHPAPAEFAVQ